MKLKLLEVTHNIFMTHFYTFPPTSSFRFPSLVHPTTITSTHNPRPCFIHTALTKLKPLSLVISSRPSMFCFFTTQCYTCSPSSCFSSLSLVHLTKSNVLRTQNHHPCFSPCSNHKALTKRRSERLKSLTQ